MTGTREPDSLRPVAVEPRSGYRIWRRYTDGVEGEADLPNLAGQGVCAAWLEPEFFEQVRISEWSSIAWNDEIELRPDAPYGQFTGKTNDDDSSGTDTRSSGTETPSPTAETLTRRRPSSEAEVNWFYGIAVRVDTVDEGPPRFCARYGERRAEVSLASLEVLAGDLSPTAYGLVVEWAAIHLAELLEAWERARDGEAPAKIAPLS